MDSIKIHNNHYSGSAQHVSASNCHIRNIITTEHKTQPNPYNANLKPTLSDSSHIDTVCTATKGTHTQLGTAVVPTRALNPI